MAKLQLMWEFMQGKQLSGQWPTIEQVQEILISWKTLSDLCFNLLKLHRIDGYRGRKGDDWLFFLSLSGQDRMSSWCNSCVQGVEGML